VAANFILSYRLGRCASTPPEESDAVRCSNDNGQHCDEELRNAKVHSSSMVS
jgi:hypothetical protein